MFDHVANCIQYFGSWANQFTILLFTLYFCFTYAVPSLFPRPHIIHCLPLFYACLSMTFLFYQQTFSVHLRLHGSFLSTCLFTYHFIMALWRLLHNNPNVIVKLFNIAIVLVSAFKSVCVYRWRVYHTYTLTHTSTGAIYLFIFHLNLNVVHRLYLIRHVWSYLFTASM